MRYCLVQPGSAAGSTKLVNASTEVLVGALNNGENKQSLLVSLHLALPETACCCTHKDSQIRLLFRCLEGEFFLDRLVIEGTVDVRPGILCAIERHSKFTTDGHGVATAWVTTVRAATTTLNSTISYRVVSN